MGMTRREITSKLEEIIDFAGIEKYVDTPVKRFSSGMTVRLGFAVAAFLEPEILVVDEVLAVGDAEFQKKAIGKMKDVSSQGGRTVLFVSHNMAAVRNLCNNGVVLKNGMIDFMGTADAAVDNYLISNATTTVGRIKDTITSIKPYINIEKILINGTDQTESTITCDQEYFDVIVSGTTTENIHANLGIFIKNTNDVPLAALSEHTYFGKYLDIPSGNFEIKKRVKLPKYYAQGDVIIELKLIETGSQILMHAYNACKISLDGTFDEFCKPGFIRWSGFVGLENML